MNPLNALQYATRLEVNAEVRYWDDGKVNGIVDVETPEPGTPRDKPAMPFATFEGESGTWYWLPIIDLATGKILDWPEGTTAEIHYKVCDAGEYFLQSADGKRIAKYRGDYVPNDFLCHGPNSQGYGDYIIFSVDASGQILGYVKPVAEEDEWEVLV